MTSEPENCNGFHSKGKAENTRENHQYNSASIESKIKYFIELQQKIQPYLVDKNSGTLDGPIKGEIFILHIKLASLISRMNNLQSDNKLLNAFENYEGEIEKLSESLRKFEEFFKQNRFPDKQEWAKLNQAIQIFHDSFNQSKLKMICHQ